MHTYTLLSWNIAGGRTSKSNTQFDYNQEDLSYFIHTIKEINADIVCLQEVHTNHERSQATEIMEGIGGKSVLNSVAHPSHIDHNFDMGNAIITKERFNHTKTVFFPNPWFDMYFKNGNKAKEHPKNVQLVQIRDIWIGNLHLLPLRLFGLEYNDNSLGQELANKIEQTLLSLPENLILAGDFNFTHPEDIYTTFFTERNLQKVPFAHEDSDHVFSHNSLEIVQTKVIKTQSDHDMLVVTFKFPAK